VSIGNGHSYLLGVVLLLFCFRALTGGAVGDFRIVAFPYREGGGGAARCEHGKGPGAGW
jgi:hypothetical protein